MRINVLVFAATILLIANSAEGISQSPTTTASPTQAATLLTQSAKELTGSIAVNDVTLTGTVELIAGSDDETGTVTYKGLSGAYRLDMAFRNGTRSEIVAPIDGAPSGSWIGLDGVAHPIANHNLMTDSGWFATLTIANLTTSPNMVWTYVGQETRNNSQVVHISALQQFPQLSGNSVSLLQHLTQVDIYLDSTTFLPVSYAFNIHPDNNALLDIPVEIRYSNYQSIGGAQIPLHTQKFINNSLSLDLQFQNASLNTGLTAAQISAQ